MPWNDIMDQLAQEAILLDPGNLAGCGKMLKLLEQLDYPEIDPLKEKIKELLEAIIMNEIDGNAPEIETIIDVTEQIRKVLMSSDGNKGDNYGIDASEASKERNEKASVKHKKTARKKRTGKVTKNIAEEKTETKSDKPAEKNTAATDSSDFEPSGFVVEDPDLLKDFITEANDHLESIEVNSVEWEKNPRDKEIINSIFRPFHTIKGVAGFLNLTEINKTAHQLENLLDECREGRLNLNPDLSDLIFDGVDILRAMLRLVEKAMHDLIEPDYSRLDLVSLYDRIGQFIDIAKRSDDEKKGIIEHTIKQPIGEILASEGKITEDEIQLSLEMQALSEQKKPLGEILVEEKKVTRRDVRDAVRKQSDVSKTTTEKHIKVDTQKMDQLLDMVGELVISQSMVAQNPAIKSVANQRLTHDIAQLGRVTKTLQNISMSMRLVPIGATFQKMNRIVRDLARKSEKEINLILEGQSAEIDRNMVEELYDPLVHMIRNSCDHGIKTPDERTKKGKPATGTILLKAEHTGGRIVITITDDGDGLNRGEILKKARKKGLVQEGEHPDNKIIDNLILMPGFSTAQKITDVSGRGVGMDVVKKTIEKLRGTIEIESKDGEGTTFTIKLPLTTAIIDGMLVKVGEETYIIPTLSVRHVVRPEAKDINKVIGRGETANIRGSLLPLKRLHEYFGIDNAVKNPHEAVLVVVENNGREVALQADSLLGKQEVVIKNLGEKLNNLEGIAGGAILGNGRIALILDIHGIVR